LLKLNFGYLNDARFGKSGLTGFPPTLNRLKEQRKGNEMNEHTPMKYGTLSITRRINAPRKLVYEAWTRIEHRKHWFVGPAWTEIERSVDLKVNGQEIAHGRFEDGTETIYTARFHLIDPNVRLIYAFDIHVGGKRFSVSLAGVGEYGTESRIKGTNGLLDQFASYLETMRRTGPRT
jgi:uncharacterized protein YndB with AHSA1/START domain